MSYILDALRKAEKDRNLGRTPSLGDVTTPVARAPARGPSTRVLALIALVAGMLVLAVLLWPRAPEPAAPPAVAVAPAAAPVTGQAYPPPPAPSGDAPRAEPGLSEDGMAGSADPALDEDVAAGSIDDLLDDSAADASLPADEATIDEGVPTEPEPAAPPAQPPAAVASPPAPPAVAAAPPEPAPAPAEAGAATLLRDMPSDYRAAFPELRVDVHVYDDDPARRWALVNGRKAVEGSTLAEGPTVSAITPEGIVFDYRGRTSLFPLKR